MYVVVLMGAAHEYVVKLGSFEAANFQPLVVRYSMDRSNPPATDPTEIILPLPLMSVLKAVEQRNLVEPQAYEGI